MGCNFPVEVYDSLREASLAAGSEDKALEILNDNLVYRGPAAEIRAEFADYIESETGFERAVLERSTKTTKGKDGSADTQEEVVKYESEGKYFARLRAKALTGGIPTLPANEEQLEATLQTLADKFAASRATALDKTGKPLGTWAVDAKTPDKKAAKAKSPRKACLAIAEKVVESGAFDKFLKRCAKHKVVVADYQTDDKAKNVLAIAWAIQAVMDAEEAQAAASFVQS